ncbi:alpha/beta fold hydrolase [Melaminivora alkalimesophila]|uniref:Pimeloyl-ACP methyl ester carboxylesterase n=1 Tax=Melaminivora alkalimesophila TaxID=1165852 RepID=A0A317RBU9_9BURK|nr:alpha/beta hydrolase [Melaminivora alkalimesophila]PWW46351.1 pimeloyl-ACP methyl ester carboxylesterase [Melaminivora alkalimesophila]
MKTSDAVTAQDMQLRGPAGARLHARRWRPGQAKVGKHAPIVLLHDSLGCIALWRDFPERLARATGREVLAYDRHGFGASQARQELPGTDFVCEEGTQVLPGLLAQWGLERCVLLGHSVGGGMAAHAAAHLGAACEALVTIAAQCFVEERTLQGIRNAQAAFADPVEFSRLEKYHGDKTQWVFDAWTKTWLSPAFADYRLDEVLGQVRCPALVLHGEHDEYGSPAHPQRIAAAVRGPVELALLPDCHHVPHREQPEEVVRRVVRFLG